MPQNTGKSYYDVAIIGGGISGLMAAYRINQDNPSYKVIVLEKGPDINRRKCPIVSGATSTCTNCPSCSIMEGMAGAGAFSDGKYVITTDYGGWLTDYLDKEMVMRYIELADSVLVEFGATQHRYMPDDSLRQLCLRYDLHMLQAQLKHLGTDSNFETMKNLIDFLRERVVLQSNCEVLNVDSESHTITIKSNKLEKTLQAEHIVFAVGRVGSRFFAEWCRNNNINMMNNQVDIGVRVELPTIIWDEFSTKIYEPKIFYRSKRYGDTTRMFCFNERGNVVMENTGGILTVNGHSYRDPARKTSNSNFALLTTIRFTEPFNEPIEYARAVASMANMISGGSVLVQRLGDLEMGRRTNAHRIGQSTTIPTLDAVPGDLSLCMPKRQLDNIIETLHMLNNIAPGTANHDTLLYGVECKYYSACPQAVDFELEGCSKIYAIGDGAGFTRSLSHAAAHGLYIADKILSS
jgi:uncharacterized FAD-dependent dehydrogenase